MGLFGSKDDSPARQDDLPAQGGGGPLDAVANMFVNRIMDLGIDGVGPLASSSAVAADALRKHHGDVEKAVAEVVRDHLKLGGAGGFVTGLGGLFTMPVALPANVLGFYTLATRMVAAIAELRGYDVRSPGGRAAVLLTLVGGDADDLLRKAGLSAVTGMTGSGRLARLAMSRMPQAAGMMVNKAIGFRLLTNVGARALGRVVRFVPIAGGIVGAGLDGLLMKRIADLARKEFTRQALAEAAAQG
ncbi:EcsC family protein [Ornithinimicrobium humiphilum]|uniref:EcsC family protein n=1 Tax=Ornithinimicrobium humiphilum TaxID=125288 RepID=A0A543KMU6_9MICO|nr:EcsC family protein [Ornithinimicrobium humiphilum]TQM96396.1 EcsC family protein [Ornithinimicrobium humiphilum]